MSSEDETIEKETTLMREDRGNRLVRIVHGSNGAASLLMPREMVEKLVQALQGKDLSDASALPAGVFLDAEGNLVFSMGSRSVTSELKWARIDDVCFP